MELTLVLDITAKCIKESDNEETWLKHDLIVGQEYKVHSISMGSSFTSVDLIVNDDFKNYNSVYLEFYCNGRKIDIYKSPLFNGYINLPIDKLLHFIDEEKKGDNNL